MTELQVMFRIVNTNSSSASSGEGDLSMLEAPGRAILAVPFLNGCGIDLLAIQQKRLDRALFLYIFIHEIRSSGVRAPITIVHIRKFYQMWQKDRSIEILCKNS